MNKIVIILPFFLYGCMCDFNQYDSRLEGIWYGNRELSLMNSDLSALSLDKRKFVEQTISDIRVEYKMGRVRVSFYNREDTSEYKKYRIIKSSKNSLTIINPSGWKNKIYFIGNCYYLVNPRYDGVSIKEYFCKK